MAIRKYTCSCCGRIRTAGWFYTLPEEALISDRPVSEWCKTCFLHCGESLPPEGAILYELSNQDAMKKQMRKNTAGSRKRGPKPLPAHTRQVSESKQAAELKNYGRVLTTRERRNIHLFSLEHLETKGYYASMAQKQRYLQSVIDRPDPEAPAHLQVQDETPDEVSNELNDLFATPRHRPDIED